MLTTSAQRCSRGTAIEIGSDRDSKIHYTVTFRPEGTTCTCPGGVYHGRCKHMARAEALRCTWTSADGEPQAREGACPRCGAATVTEQPPSEIPEFRIAITLTGPASTSMTARPTACELLAGHHFPGCASRHAATAFDLARINALSLAASAGHCTGCTLELLSAELLSAARVLHNVA